MTPGNQANMVSKMLINKVDPTPCFMNTANGGNKMFRIMVSNDMLFCIGYDITKVSFPIL